MFLDAVLEIFPEESKKLLVAEGRGGRGWNESAFEMWGYRTFWMFLPLVPKDLNSKQLQDDRLELFKVFSHEEFETLRPSALAEFRRMLDVVENEFLGDGTEVC